MRVCKHGCDVKMFCFSRANHASTNLKKFLNFIYPIPSGVERIFPNPLAFISGYANTANAFYCLNEADLLTISFQRQTTEYYLSNDELHGS